MRPLEAKHTRPQEGGASYPLKHRLFRMAWSLTWLLLAAWTPPPLHRWRVFLLNMAGANVHVSAHVYPSARIWFPPHLSMAEYACLGPNVNCYCMAPISLGRNAVVSQGAHLCAGTHDIEDEHFQLVVRPITIEEDVWVAAEVFIGPGVTLHKRAVVGARAVLFRDAEKNKVYAGNPALPIRDRS